MTSFLQPQPYWLRYSSPKIVTPFFVGAQMAVSLQRTTQIILGVSVIIVRIPFAVTNKTQKYINRYGTFSVFLFLFFVVVFLHAPHVYMRALTLYCFHRVISTETFRGR